MIPPASAGISLTSETTPSPLPTTVQASCSQRPQVSLVSLLSSLCIMLCVTEDVMKLAAQVPATTRFISPASLEARWTFSNFSSLPTYPNVVRCVFFPFVSSFFPRFDLIQDTMRRTILHLLLFKMNSFKLTNSSLFFRIHNAKYLDQVLAVLGRIAYTNGTPIYSWPSVGQFLNEAWRLERIGPL